MHNTTSLMTQKGDRNRSLQKLKQVKTNFKIVEVFRV